MSPPTAAERQKNIGHASNDVFNLIFLCHCGFEQMKIKRGHSDPKKSGGWAGVGLDLSLGRSLWKEVFKNHV